MSEARELAKLAIEKDDTAIYDCAANHGQMVGNVRDTRLFLDLLEEWIEDDGVEQYQYLRDESEI